MCLGSNVKADGDFHRRLSWIRRVWVQLQLCGFVALKVQAVWWVTFCVENKYILYINAWKTSSKKKKDKKLKLHSANSRSTSASEVGAARVHQQTFKANCYFCIYCFFFCFFCCSSVWNYIRTFEKTWATLVLNLRHFANLTHAVSRAGGGSRLTLNHFKYTTWSCEGSQQLKTSLRPLHILTDCMEAGLLQQLQQTHSFWMECLFSSQPLQATRPVILK